MNDKEIIESLFDELRYLQLRYLYIPLDDFLWEHFIREADELRDKYKVHGENMDRLCRDMIVALTSYKERKDKNDQENKNDQRGKI